MRALVYDLMEWCRADGTTPDVGLTLEGQVEEHGCVAVRFLSETDADAFEAWLPALVHSTQDAGTSRRFIFNADYLGIMLRLCTVHSSDAAARARFDTYMVSPDAMYGVYTGIRALSFDKTLGAKSPLRFARAAEEALRALAQDRAKDSILVLSERLSSLMPACFPL